jgi:hypothetical protein
MDRLPVLGRFLGRRFKPMVDSNRLGQLADGGRRTCCATSSGGKGSPHAGSYFLHGGINTGASNAIVRQDIDLLVRLYHE